LVSVGCNEEMKNRKQYDIDNYKTIVFDEIFLYEPRRLKRIAELMKQYPDKILYCNWVIVTKEAPVRILKLCII